MKASQQYNSFDVGNLLKKDAIFITGTGTDVGKTFASGFIARQLVKKGFQVAYMKAVQTGLSESKPDHEIVKRICPEIIALEENLSCPYRFDLPASPHLSAKNEKRKIIPQKIIGTFNAIRKQYPSSKILVEGAGGTMVPIVKKYMMIDLICDLKIPAIIVSLPSLGTINHTLLTVAALRSRKIQILGIAFSMNENQSGILVEDNIRTIKDSTKIKNCGIIPKIINQADY